MISFIQDRCVRLLPYYLSSRYHNSNATMRESMRIALAQINPTVGDFVGNVNRMVRAARDAAGRNAEVVVFPELALTGYPPRDLVEKSAFLDGNEAELERLARETASLDASIVCGFVARSRAETGKRAFNSAAVIEQGRVIFQQNKMLLPTYD